MKKNIILLSVFIGLISCVNTPVVKQEKSFILKRYLDEFLVQNPNCIDNEITRKENTEKLTIEFLELLGDSIPCITELPVAYDMALKVNDSTYIVKFTCGKYTSGLNISDDYDVSFQVFSLVNKEKAASLKDGQLYFIQGECYQYADNNTFPLPSKKKYKNYPNITSRSVGVSSNKQPDFNLGTLVVHNPSFLLKE